MRLLAWCLLFAVPVSAAPNASLEKAGKLYADLNYIEAGKALDAALKQPGNDRASLLKILELQAVVQATVGQSEKSARLFEQLLMLNPDFKLEGNYPPRVTTAFYEARGWVEANGHLEAKPLDPVVEPGAIKQLRVEVTKDPMKQVKKVRFHFDPKGELVAPLTGTTATAALKAGPAEVSWWAELLGDKDAVLLEVVTSAAPRVDKAPAKPAKPEAGRPAEPARTDAPVAVATVSDPGPPPPTPPLVEPPLVTAPPRRSEPLGVKKIAALGLGGAGVVGAALGVVFGLNANAARAQFDKATRNGGGQITGLTQVQAYQLDASQRTQATASNVLFVSGIALAAGGGALFFLSLGDSRVSVVPTGPGVAIVGALP